LHIQKCTALSNKAINSFSKPPLLFIRRILLLIVAVGSSCIVFSQTQFSLATDFSLLRSFKKSQRYWAVGQTVHVHFHFTPKDGAYAWLSYYSEGRFRNEAAAPAKSPSTIPQLLRYDNAAALRFKHISIGWRHYLKGGSNYVKGLNTYGIAGFGLMLGSINNTHSVIVDTSQYTLPVEPGKANFKRLTLDLGLGLEMHLGADIYFYFEGRGLIPTTDYPSRHLFVNDNAPFTATANVGFRILLY
jgi:hypothetical protein